jgi:hypothetical protein
MRTETQRSDPLFQIRRICCGHQRHIEQTPSRLSWPLIQESIGPDLQKDWAWLSVGALKPASDGRLSASRVNDVNKCYKSCEQLN